jgi:hypothetical protein
MQETGLSLALVLHRGAESSYSGKLGLRHMRSDTAQTVEAHGTMFGALSIARAKQRQVEKYY